MIRILTPLALLLASGLASPAIAQADEPNSTRVSYADLNLAASAGQQALQHRISGAARLVCEMEYPKGVVLVIESHACRRDAIARTQPAFEAAVAAARHGSVTVLDAAALMVTSH